MNYWSAEMSNMDVTRSLFDYIQVILLQTSLTCRGSSPFSAEYLGTPWRVHCSGSIQHQRRIRDTRWNECAFQELGRILGLNAWTFPTDFRPYWYEAWRKFCSMGQLSRYNGPSYFFWLTERPCLRPQNLMLGWYVFSVAVCLVNSVVDDTCVGSFWLHQWRTVVEDARMAVGQGASFWAID